MITKTKINKILHLGSTCQRKLPQENNGHKSNQKKVHFKFHNDHNNIIARSIQFANKYIISGGLEVKDAHLVDALLSQAKEFDLYNSTLYKRGWAQRRKVEGSLYGSHILQTMKMTLKNYSREENIIHHTR